MAGIGANSLGAIQNPGSSSGRLESFPVQGAFPRQPSPKPTTGIDRGLWLTLRAIRRQLEAMPHDLFLIRSIHHATRRPFPGERLWTTTQLLNPATVRFLRIRNREGCDIYIWPYAEDQNAGYILLDLDGAVPSVIETMRANGHEPCVVLQTSPGHLQAWIHVSTLPLQSAVATAIGKHLARLYGGDSASTDWRHLGRLAGFTNQKPQRRTVSGHAPWVKIVHASAGLARNAEILPQSAHTPALASQGFDGAISQRQLSLATGQLSVAPPDIEAAEAVEIYQSWTRRWRIAERFTPPDWSIVDLWIARKLLSQGMLAEQVQDVLRLASPHFPRRHTAPDEYLRRTMAYACSFPAHAAARVPGPLKKHAMDCPPHG
jgi:RepB DNA-primase N-terminal domain/RepB DNA-primase C-terminal helical domain